MDLLKEAGNALSVVAPMLATAVGGPLAGTAVSFICKALGLSDTASSEEVAAALQSATPDQLLALKQAENEFQTAMRKLEVDASALGYADTANARDREKTIKDWTPKIMGYLVLVAFIVMAGAVLSGHASADSVIAGTIIGYMSAKAEQVMAYYFGSSAGGREKSQQLANSVSVSAINAIAPGGLRQ